MCVVCIYPYILSIYIYYILWLCVWCVVPSCVCVCVVCRGRSSHNSFWQLSHHIHSPFTYNICASHTTRPIFLHIHTIPPFTHTYILLSHTHTFSLHTHTFSLHRHTFSLHTHTFSLHTHTFSLHTHTFSLHTHTFSLHTHTFSLHTHTFSLHTHKMNGQFLYRTSHTICTPHMKPFYCRVFEIWNIRFRGV